jgi:hypothetical protein
VAATARARVLPGQCKSPLRNQILRKNADVHSDLRNGLVPRSPHSIEVRFSRLGSQVNFMGWFAREALQRYMGLRRVSLSRISAAVLVMGVLAGCGSAKPGVATSSAGFLRSTQDAPHKVQVHGGEPTAQKNWPRRGSVDSCPSCGGRRSALA